MTSLATLMVFATILVPLVTGLMQVIKTAIDLPKNWIPAIALFVGILIGFLAYPFTDFSYDLRLWAGALAGLSSVGAYEVVNKRSGTTKE